MNTCNICNTGNIGKNTILNCYVKISICENCIYACCWLLTLRYLAIYILTSIPWTLFTIKLFNIPNLSLEWRVWVKFTRYFINDRYDIHRTHYLPIRFRCFPVYLLTISQFYPLKLKEFGMKVPVQPITLISSNFFSYKPTLLQYQTLTEKILHA